MCSVSYLIHIQEVRVLPPCVLNFYLLMANYIPLDSEVQDNLSNLPCLNISKI